MKKYEASARTVEEAIEQGLQELGVSIGDVDVQVLEEGSKGLFGLFGSRLARVSLTVRDEGEDLLDSLISDEKPAKKAPAEQPPVKEEAPVQAPVQQAEAEEKPQDDQPAKREEKAEVRPAPVKRVAAKKPEKKPARAAQPAAEGQEDEPEQSEDKPEIRVMEKPEITVIPQDQLDPESPAGVACSFLKEITHLMGVDVSIEMGCDPEGNVTASMTGDPLGILIGRRGETLDALQYLTSLKVNRGREGYVRVTLDSENYRARREDTLIRLANRMANRAVRTGRRVSLEPMNPYERRIIHFALQQNESVSTHSEGDEPNRHVVITVKK